MNIFFVDEDPKVAARCLVDRHVVKMVLESCQLLCTTFHLQGIDAPYKPTHKNHPCAIWCRESKENFDWLLEHSYELLVEYTRRYDKIHKSHIVYRWVIENKIRLKFDKELFTRPALAMPDIYKRPNPVDAYREYYRVGKASLHSWKMNKPDWIH